MMSNYILAKPITNGTLNVSSTTVGGADVNMLRQGVSNIASLNSLTKTVVYDMGAIYTIGVIAMMYTNGATSWQAKLADTEANLTAAPAYDSGSITHDPTRTGGFDRVHAAVFPSAVSARWASVTITKTEDYQVAKFIVAEVFSPVKSINNVAVVPVNNLNEGETHGDKFKTLVNTYRAVTATFPVLTDAENYGDGGFAEISLLAAGSTELVLVLKKDDLTNLMHQMFLGHLEVASSSYLRVDGWDQFNVSFNFDEVLLP